VSRENVEVVQRGWDHFSATGEPMAEVYAPGFVWDMSTFRGWPESQTYEGLDGVRRFLHDWGSAFDDWRVELDSIHDVGEQVVLLLRQHGRAKATGMVVDMSLGMVFTLQDGLQTWMQMYADPDEALRAAGADPRQV